MARKKLHENQLELFPETPASAQLGLKQLYLGLLWKLFCDGAQENKV